MTARARLSQAEIAQAKSLAEGVGLRLVGYEKRPDGTVKLEFGEPEEHDDFRTGSPLYAGRSLA